MANRRAYPIDQARRAGTEAPVANRRAYPSLPIKAPQGKARQWIVDSEGVVKEDWWRDAINHSEPRRILDWEAEAKTPEAKAYLTGFLAELEAAKNIAQGGGTGLAPTYEANRTLQEASITGWVNMGSVYPKGWNKAEYEKLKRAVNNINKGRPLTDAQRNNIEKALAPAMYLDEHFQRAGESDSKMANYVEQFKKEPFVPKGREPVTPGGLFYFDPASKTAIRDKGRKGPEVPNEAPPIEGFAEHQVPAQDDRMHSVLPMELPEINILATELMGGKHPKVRKKLGEAHGLFSAGESRSSANIALRADIFQVLTPYEKAALGKEAIEEVAKEKAVGEWTGFPSNDAMRRFASDNAKSIAKRYDTLKKEMENRVKFERSSPMARKTLLHEIGHLQDWLPDFMVQGRGNVFGHIAALRNYTLKMITEVPNNPEAAFSKKDRRFFRSQAQRATKRPPKNASKADLEAYRDNVSKLYKRILAREAKNRGVIFLDELKPELYNLHKWYRGVTEVDDYFKQPHELYADSFSAIMNNPGAVQKRAPLFWKLFWNYQETRPEAAQAYNAIQNGIKAGTVHRDLNINLRETMAAGDMTALQAQKASDHRTKSEYLDGLLYQVVRRTAPIHRRLMAEKNPNVRGPVLKSLNDYTHRGAGHELFMAQLNKRVYGKLDANNLDWLDLGVFLFHHRVIHERYGKANPFGFDAKSSTASLEEMRKTFGEDRYKAVEEAAKEFRALYDEHVVKLLDKYKILDPALQKYITDNIHYATFAATKGSAGDQYSIEAALKRRYGSATTGHIYRQIGNLGHIANPATATASKALSLISMAHREYSKRLAVEWLRESPYSNEVPDARTVFNGKARVPMMRNDGRIKTLVYMHKGEIKGVDMPRSLADSLQQGDPIENTLIAKAATMITRPVKSVYTGLNYGFWPVATIRDLQDVARKLPKAAFWGKRGVMKYAKQSYLEARSTLAGDDMLPGGEEALKRKFLVSVADNRGLNTQDQAFEQLLVRYHQTPQTWKNAHDRPVSGLRRAWLKYVNQGQILERTTKIMGMHYMDANFPDMPEWKKQDTIIHNAGTPNIKESAALNRYIDVFGLFYNPWKEGLISEAKAFKESNAEYAWKSIKYSLLPKAAMIAMAGGLLGKWLEDMFEAVPEYDKTNYIIVPLFWYDKAQKKLAYVRLPLSEYIRFTGGILWKLSSKIRGEEAQPASKGLFAYAGGQLPSGNPVSHVGMAWINYKLFGRNTPDDFTGYNILSNDVLDAQDSRTDIALAKWSYNQLTGNLFGRFEDQSIMEPERGRAEKFLRLPVVSNLIGRYIKISNRGLYDKYSIPIDKARQEDARDRLDTHEAVEAILSGNPLRTPIPITKSDSMRRMLGKAVISRTSPEMRILENARSRREKMMILDEMNRED
ncbi:MAG: hypothetical protein OEQ39_12725 [Gammaproteobacteria bacterium]|nr:hypothetical protein [Gammaproteobacteria bacterium]